MRFYWRAVERDKHGIKALHVQNYHSVHFQNNYKNQRNENLDLSYVLGKNNRPEYHHKKTNQIHMSTLSFKFLIKIVIDLQQIFTGSTIFNLGMKIFQVWFRLRLHGIGYVQIPLESDPLWYGSTLFTRDRFETGTVRFGIALISGPIWCQIADTIRTGSTRSRVNTRLIRTNFVLIQNGSGPV